MNLYLIALIVFLWLFIGLWICAKRNWYEHWHDEQPWGVIFGILLMPLNLMIVFIKEFLVREWDNQDT